MEYFNTLPTDITLDILSRVPTDLILDCKLVSKFWNHLISHHPLFSRKHLHHLNHPSTATSTSGKLGILALIDEKQEEWFRPAKQILHYFEYDDENHESATPIGRIRKVKFTPPFGEPERISFVGSIDGLICVAQNPYNIYNDKHTLRPVCICNPVIREYVILPEIKKDCSTNVFIRWTVGFGYVSSTNEYKVIGIYMYNFEYVEVYIYTLGSGLGWRNLGKFYSNEFNYIGQDERGVFGDGVFCWVNVSAKLMSYDLVQEKFCEDLSRPDGYWYDMGILDGVLFFATRPAERNDCFDVWLLKKKNDNHGKQVQEQEEHRSLSWTKEFMVESPFGSRLVAITKSGGALTYIHNHLNIYDTKASTSKRLVDFKEQIHQIFPHKHTFLSLKDLGEEDTKIMESDD